MNFAFLNAVNAWNKIPCVSQLFHLHASIYVTDFKKSMLQVFASEIQSSVSIEDISLSTMAIRSSIAKQVKIDIPSWNVTHLKNINKREKQAVEATLFTLTFSKPMSIEMLLNIHQKLEPDSINILDDDVE